MTVANTMSFEEKLACPIYRLPLSTRGHNILKTRGYETIAELVSTDARALLASPGCGAKTVAEVLACLKMVDLKMANSDGLFPESVIEGRIASIREYLADLRKPKPKVETFREKQTKEIKRKQLMVMLMRANGTPFRAIAKEVGCTQTTARVYFSRFARSLAWEARKRRIPVSDVLSERNIPLAVLELMEKDGVQITWEGLRGGKAVSLLF